MKYIVLFTQQQNYCHIPKIIKLLFLFVDES